MNPLIQLPDSISVSEVTGLREQWLQAMEHQPDNTLIDARAVVDIDGAGIQLLAALAQSLAARGQTLQLLAPSATLTEALQRMGLTFATLSQSSEAVA
jgi:anti-anti-sigma regulatory factor